TLSVATGFGGGSKSTLFTILGKHRAVPIKHLSQYHGEDEWVLKPGTKLHVKSVKKDGNVHKIELQEAMGEQGGLS
ncbi:unnamed protein product, partial [Amoebophrya sp. A25]